MNVIRTLPLLSKLYRHAIACAALVLVSHSIAFSQDVDPLTGRASISVPLGGISAYDLSVSLGLSHHGGSLKVSEAPGNAGMGFNAHLGNGFITREVRGLPDEYNAVGPQRKGWLYNHSASSIQNFTATADDKLGVCSDETTDWNFVNSLIVPELGPNFFTDIEPDIYYFQVPGGISGKFVYAPDGSIKMIPYQDIQITPIDSTGFTIKTNTGIIYTFGSPDRVTRMTGGGSTFSGTYIPQSNYSYYSDPISFYSTWNLTKVYSASTGATINYLYSPGEYALSPTYFTGIQPNYTNKADTLYYLGDIVAPQFLRQITLNKYKVDITWTNSLVSKILISELETNETKEYDLVYKSIKSTSDNLLAPIYRPFLMEVKQQISCLPFPSYRFTYQGVDPVNATANIPWRTSWGQDFFGYYNGQDNNKNIPTVYFYSADSGARRYRVTPIPGVTAADTLVGGNRSVNGAYNSFGAVTRIDYPTGGSTTYTYEPNKYYDGLTSEELFGAGVRVSSITTSGGEIAYGKTTTNSGYHTLKKTYQYGTTDANTVTSGKILYPPVFAYTDGTTHYRSQSDLGPGSEVLYSRTKELITGQGYRVYQYDLPNVYPDAVPSATTSKVARKSGTTCAAGFLKNGSYTFPFAPLTDYNFKRGYLTRLSEFSEAGVLTKEKRISYSMPQASTVIKGVRAERFNDIYYYSVYQIPVNQSRIVAQEIVKQVGDVSAADSTKVTTAYAYNSKNMLKKTTQTNDDNSVEVGYVKYAQDFAITTPAVGDTQANAIYKLNTNNRYGEVIETYRKFLPIGATDTVTTGAKLTIFKDYGTFVWPYQSKSFPQGLSFTGATGSATNFTADSDYILNATYDYVNALPVGQTGMSLVPSGAHYSTNAGLPLTSFANCKGVNAVYEGFELASANGLTVTGAKVYQPAWTGKNSIQLTSAVTLSSTSLVTKGESTYRISCWVYATANSSIVVKAKNGATDQSSVTLSYTTPNQWTYLEGFMDMTNVSASFTIQVTSATTVQLDDFAALPKSARMSSSTYLPLTGVTSQSDDRGNSTIVTYDVMGRQQNTFDRKRNLVGVQEYGLQQPGTLALNANFSADASQYVIGTPITFTADPNGCITAAGVTVTYDWTFTSASDGTITHATGSSTAKTFANFGAYNVTLTVSAPGYTTVSYTDNICVAMNFTPSLSVTPNVAYNPCAVGENGQRTFNASISTGHPPAGWNLKYEWWYTNAQGIWEKISRFNQDGSLIVAPGTDTTNGYPQMLSNPNTNEISIQCPLYSYDVICIITLTAVSPIVQSQCVSNEMVGEAKSGVAYAPSGNCQ